MYVCLSLSLSIYPSLSFCVCVCEHNSPKKSRTHLDEISSVDCNWDKEHNAGRVQIIGEILDTDYAGSLNISVHNCLVVVWVLLPFY